MSNPNFSQSRRSFLKFTGAAAASLAVMNFAAPAFAANAKIKQLKLSEIPHDNIAIAKNSELVQNAYQYLLKQIDSLKSADLKAKVKSFYDNTVPTFMENFQSKAAVSKVYAELKAEGLIDPAKTPEDQLFPKLSSLTSGPQPFFSAPGSGYGSHHPYPGGLCTHTAANMEITQGIIATYRDIMGYDADYDAAIAGELLHDLAKPWVFQWNADGSSFKEYTIAGTGAHHIFSVAESIYRGMPANEIVAQACAHNHPGSDADEAQVVGWIKAASILAGADPVARDLLTSDRKHLPQILGQEGFIVHLGDHDWVLSSPAAKISVNLIAEVAKKEFGFSDADLKGARFNYLRNYIGAQYSYMRFHHAVQHGSGDAYKNALSVVRAVIA